MHDGVVKLGDIFSSCLWGKIVAEVDYFCVNIIISFESVYMFLHEVIYFCNWYANETLSCNWKHFNWNLICMKLMTLIASIYSDHFPFDKRRCIGV